MPLLIRMKKIIHLLFPSFVRRRLYYLYVSVRREARILRAFIDDYIRYRSHSFNSTTFDKNQIGLESMIVMEAHAIEKGFSLPDIRPGYGAARIKTLIHYLEAHKQRNYGSDGFAVRKARAILSAYIKYHNEISYDLGSLLSMIEPWGSDDCSAGGYITVSREEIRRKAAGNFRDFVMSRHSVRNYIKNGIDAKQIREAIEIARMTPSVCNRQPWHVYAITDIEIKKSILELQNGNRGFGSLAPLLLIVTTDIRSFTGAEERNEAYVDGGLFAMSLIYALHYIGIGSCPLNWMVMPARDRELRRLLGLRESETVIMLIAAGHIAEKVRIAQSARRAVNDILTII